MIDANKFMKGKVRKPTVCFPNNISKEYLPLWGYYHVESNYYNVIDIKEPSTEMGGSKPILLGHFYAAKPEEYNPEDKIIGYYEDGNIIFNTNDGTFCELTPVELKIDIFSRNTGILESDIMLKKGAIIIGCGSVGSLVAMELARAGVGRFFLIDMDVMGYHNICRHQCGMQDVGKYKVIAVKERILQINPSAEVITSTKMIQDDALDII
jgi:hypothetical protein